MEQALDRFTLAEAHFEMADVLSAAALYRAEIRVWPPRLEEAVKFIGREFTRDPFTGQILHYRLSQKMPTLATHAPRWMSKYPNLVFNLDLARRVKVDETLQQSASKSIRMRKIKAQEAALEAQKEKKPKPSP
jgi:hypothetical protein